MLLRISCWRRTLHRAPSSSAHTVQVAVGGSLAVFALAGCALQPAYQASERPVLAAWSTSAGANAVLSPADLATWWRALGDPAVDALVEVALADSPSLAQAVARIDEANATLGVQAASRLPSASGSASLTRAQSQNSSAQAAGSTALSTSASMGPSLSWEVDLFGRVRQSIEAARIRVDARSADAATTRLALAADITSNVLALRACASAQQVWVEDIASRERTLQLTRQRLAVGFAAPVDEARAVSGIASSRTSLASQVQQCAQHVNALVALSGQDAATVRQRVGGAQPSLDAIQRSMPDAPASAPALPAAVLARHPSVVAAEREAAAAWADIGVARANRMPRLDLAAALTGQWLRAAGSSLNFTTWSAGTSLSANLFDGGAGAANVSAAEARYRLATASLHGTLRSTVLEVENALAAQASAQARSVSTRDGLAAARTTLQAAQAQWQAGAISLFELEDSRRLLASAQDAYITARRDQAQAWVTLVKATGGAIVQSPELQHP
jgi:NodT family efflux transporter outer membrane factor (OMF) lipoprotein